MRSWLVAYHIGFKILISERVGYRWIFVTDTVELIAGMAFTQHKNSPLQEFH